MVVCECVCVCVCVQACEYPNCFHNSSNLETHLQTSPVNSTMLVHSYCKLDTFKVYCTPNRLQLCSFVQEGTPPSPPPCSYLASTLNLTIPPPPPQNQNPRYNPPCAQLNIIITYKEWDSLRSPTPPLQIEF